MEERVEKEERVGRGKEEWRMRDEEQGERT